MILFAVQIETKGVLGPLNGVSQPHQGTRIILVGVLELHGDPSILGDQPFRGEGDLGGVVIDHVVVLLAAYHLLAIDEHALRSREYDDDGAGLIALQTVWALYAFHTLYGIARELALADGHAHTHPGLCVFAVPQWRIEAEALGLLQVREEVALRPLQHDIAGNKGPSLLVVAFK